MVSPDPHELDVSMIYGDAVEDTVYEFACWDVVLVEVEDYVDCFGGFRYFAVVVGFGEFGHGTEFFEGGEGLHFC